MSNENISASENIEPEDSISKRDHSRAARVAAWIAGSGLIVAGGLVCFEYLSREDEPCVSSTNVDDSFTSSVRTLELSDGKKVMFTIYPASSDLNTEHPHVAVSAGTGAFGGTTQVIENPGSPGPEASFTFEKTKLLVNATDTTITTSCESLTITK